jgi:hypothetical protein
VHLTRRSALASAGLALVTACTRRTARPARVLDPDEALKAAAVVREQALLNAYDDALRTAPALAARLAPLRADHAEHLAALSGAASPGAPATSGAASTPSTGAASTPGGQPPQAVLHALATLERTAATGHTADALIASRRLAPVLASLAACEASHLVVL